MSEKIKYDMEFPIQASSALLYQYISTPSGMQEWYADNVNSRGEFFNFIRIKKGLNQRMLDIIPLK